jgi:hypothetical protein
LARPPEAFLSAYKPAEASPRILIRPAEGAPNPSPNSHTYGQSIIEQVFAISCGRLRVAAFHSPMRDTDETILLPQRNIPETEPWWDGSSAETVWDSIV